MPLGLLWVRREGCVEQPRLRGWRVRRGRAVWRGWRCRRGRDCVVARPSWGLVRGHPAGCLLLREVLGRAGAIAFEADLALVLRNVEVNIGKGAEIVVAVDVVDDLRHVPDVVRELVCRIN